MGEAATYTGTTLCVIKPHCVAAGCYFEKYTSCLRLLGLAGKIIKEIQTKGFKITALRMCTLSPIEAEEFLEVYDGAVPYFKESSCCYTLLIV